MKTKMSITLSEDLLKEMDQFLGKSGNRSAFVEEAVREFLVRKAHQMREAKDLEILNRRSKKLNKEAEDVLSYQIGLGDAVNSIAFIKGLQMTPEDTGYLLL